MRTPGHFFTAAVLTSLVALAVVCVPCPPRVAAVLSLEVGGTVLRTPGHFFTAAVLTSLVALAVVCVPCPPRVAAVLSLEVGGTVLHDD